MNTGERLTALSGLSPRSAFDHFMAIVTGGVNKTVFASQMTVRVDLPTTSIVLRRKNTSGERPQETDPSPRNSNPQNKKRTDIRLATNKQSIQIQQDSCVVLLCTEHQTICRKLPVEHRALKLERGR